VRFGEEGPSLRNRSTPGRWQVSGGDPNIYEKRNRTGKNGSLRNPHLRRFSFTKREKGEPEAETGGGEGKLEGRAIAEGGDG